MYVNVEYRDTYTRPEFANARYPSSAEQSIDGWAYILTKDPDYLHRLAHYHLVEVRENGEWVPFQGQIDEAGGYDDEPPPFAGNDESDPNY